MGDGDLGWFGTLLVSASAALAWLGGEAGKIMVAGAAGGLVRWLASEKRRLRDGVLAAIGGGVTSSYMWPLGLHLPRLVRLEAFPKTPSNIALSAFLIGSLGTSAVKIITTYIEKRAASMTKGSGHEG